MATRWLVKLENMKYFFGVTLIILCGCGVSKRTPANGGILDAIHKSQKAYYNLSLKENPEYTSLLNISDKGRKKLYRDNKIKLENYDKFTILEGYANGWGDYVGFLLTPSGNWYYSRTSSTPWVFKKIGIAESDFEKETGVAPEIVNTIVTWDTAYINSLKKEVGNIVHDGSSFWAIKVERGHDKPTITNYTFYEYPVRKQ